MVHLAITLPDVGNAVEQLAFALQSVARSTRLERGCTNCGVWYDASEGAVRYDETWLDECSLRSHVQSVRFTQLLEIMESAPHPPEIHVDILSERRGLEYIASIRGD